MPDQEEFAALREVHEEIMDIACIDFAQAMQRDLKLVTKLPFIPRILQDKVSWMQKFGPQCSNKDIIQLIAKEKPTTVANPEALIALMGDQTSDFLMMHSSWNELTVFLPAAHAYCEQHEIEIAPMKIAASELSHYLRAYFKALMN